ncbi:MAG: HIT domain-containing protein, partial [Candidatus Omnitrophica bacterium]|nr:HIT domain-containing protein [Candidatus Omnitrophota bacterium]
MDKLWAPWRIKYIRANNKRGCIFCQAKKKEGSDYVFLKAKHSLAMLNIFPYNNGHAMIAPLKHVKDLDELKQVEILDLVSTLQKTKKMLKKVLQPQGYNIGINLSREAGAGIPGHLHIHIVPR